MSSGGSSAGPKWFGNRRWNNSRDDFALYHRRLRGEIRAKGRSYAIAIRGLRPFNGLKYTGDTMEYNLTDDDSYKLLQLDGSQDSKLKQEAAGDKATDERTQRREQRDIARAKAISLQSRYNEICDNVYRTIIESIDDDIFTKLLNHGVRDGDGIHAFHSLVELFEATSPVSLVRLLREFWKIRQTTILDLEKYLFRFKELIRIFTENKLDLPPLLNVIVLLEGLLPPYEIIRNTIYDELAQLKDADAISIDGYIKRVKSYHTRRLVNRSDKASLTKTWEQNTGRESGGRPKDKNNGQDRSQGNGKGNGGNPKGSTGKGSSGERKMNCWNCGKLHIGGERSCKAPCKICKSKDHTRYGCPQRKKKQEGKLADDVPDSGDTTIKGDAIDWGFMTYHVDEPVEDFEDRALILKRYTDSCASDHFHALNVDVRIDPKGDSHSMSLDGIRVHDIKPISGSVHAAGGTVMPYKYSATVGDLERVKLVPGLTDNLVSVSRICDDEKSYVIFTSKHVYKLAVQANSTLLQNATEIGDREGGMYTYHYDQAMLTDIGPKNPLEKLHQALCHRSLRRILKGIKDGAVDHRTLSRMPAKTINKWLEDMSQRPCRACGESKAISKPRKRSIPKAVKPGMIWQFDVCGPITPPSIQLHDHFIMGIDRATSYSIVATYAGKGNVVKAFDLMLTKLERHAKSLGVKAQVEVMRCDGDTLLLGNECQDVASSHGIKLVEQSAPYSHAFNQEVERTFRTIQEMSRASIIHNYAPGREWRSAVYNSNFIRNIIPNAEGKVPWYEFFGVRPVSLDRIRTFYSPVFVKRIEGRERARSEKFQPLALLGFFLGYGQTPVSDGYLVRLPGKSKPLLRRDCYFIEDVQQGMHLRKEKGIPTEDSKVKYSPTDDSKVPSPWDQEKVNTGGWGDKLILFPDTFSEACPRCYGNVVIDTCEKCGLKLHESPKSTPENKHHGKTDQPLTRTDSPTTSPDWTRVSSNSTTPATESTPTPSIAPSQLDSQSFIDPSLLEEIKSSKEKNHQSFSESDSTNSSTRPKRERLPRVPFNLGGAQEDIQYLINQDEVLMLRQLQTCMEHGFLTKEQIDYVNIALSEVYVPKTYYDAVTCLDSPYWIRSIEKEYDNMHKQQVWTFVDDDGKPKRWLDLRYVFAAKGDEKGLLDKRKTRIVARGFTQQAGLDYIESHAPVVRTSTLRMVISLAHIMGWVLYQFDYTAAFLNATIDVDLYIRPLPGMKIPQGKIPKLKKAIYGTVQASHRWHKALNRSLTKRNYHALKSDPCLYVKNEKGKISLIVVHVDDGVLSGSDEQAIVSVLEDIKSEYKISYGKLQWFLGMNIRSSSHSDQLVFDLSQHITNLATKFRKTSTRPYSSPLDPHVKFIANPEQQSKDNIRLYQQIVGALNFLSCMARPDITHSVSKLAKYLRNPSSTHLTQANRCIAFLWQTKNYHLSYYRQGNPALLERISKLRTDTRHSTHPRPHKPTTSKGTGEHFCITEGLSALHLVPSGKIPEDNPGTDKIIQEHIPVQSIFCPRKINEINYIRQLPVVGYFDADYGGCNETYRSTSGNVSYIGHNLISWGSPRQTITAQAVFESELISANMEARDLTFISKIKGEITSSPPNRAFLLGDNQATIKVMKTGKISARTRHIGIKFMYVHEQFNKGLIGLGYIHTDDNPADALTKVLNPEKHVKAMQLLGVHKGDCKFVSV